MATGAEAHGAQIKIGDGASPEVFTAIALINSGPDGPDVSQNIIEAFTHDSNFPTKKATYVNTGTVTFSVLYDSTDTQHIALRDAATNSTRTNFQVVLNETGAEQLDFSAYVTFAWANDPSDFSQANITLDIDGAITPS